MFNVRVLSPRALELKPGFDELISIQLMKHGASAAQAGQSNGGRIASRGRKE